MPVCKLTLEVKANKVEGRRQKSEARKKAQARLKNNLAWVFL